MAAGSVTYGVIDELEVVDVVGRDCFATLATAIGAATRGLKAVDTLTRWDRLHA